MPATVAEPMDREISESDRRSRADPEARDAAQLHARWLHRAGAAGEGAAVLTELLRGIGWLAYHGPGADPELRPYTHPDEAGLARSLLLRITRRDALEDLAPEELTASAIREHIAFIARVLFEEPGPDELVEEPYPELDQAIVEAFGEPVRGITSAIISDRLGFEKDDREPWALPRAFLAAAERSLRLYYRRSSNRARAFLVPLAGAPAEASPEAAFREGLAINGPAVYRALGSPRGGMLRAMLSDVSRQETLLSALHGSAEKAQRSEEEGLWLPHDARFVIDRGPALQPEFFPRRVEPRMRYGLIARGGDAVFGELFGRLVRWRLGEPRFYQTLFSGRLLAAALVLVKAGSRWALLVFHLP